MRVSLRGIAFALLVLTAVAVLKTNGRPLKVSRALVAAAAIAAGAVEWPSADSVVRAAAGIGYLAI